MRRGVIAAGLLALLVAAPALSHSIADTPVIAGHPTADSAAMAAEAIVGTVVELTVENRLDQTTHHYFELERDDGTTIPLTGPLAQTLQHGAEVAIRGRQNGPQLSVDEVQELSPPRASGAVTDGSTVQIEGTLLIAHADDFAAGVSRYLHQLRDDTGAITALDAAVLPSELRGAMRVIVSGELDPQTLSLHPQYITILSDPAGNLATSSGLTAKAATVNSVLVIMANFSDTVAPSYTSAQAQQVMVTDLGGVANYFSEVSYGQQSLNVTVTADWVTMNLAATCSYTSIASAANTAAQAVNPAYTASNYNFVVYLFPSQPCGWAGLAYVGSPH